MSEQEALVNQSNAPSVRIVIPAYNAGRFLDAVLRTWKGLFARKANEIV